MIRINLLSAGPKTRKAKPQYDVRAQALLGVGVLLVTVAGGLMMAGLRRFREGASPTAPLLAAGVVFGLLTMVRPEQTFIWALAFAVYARVAPPASAVR